MAAMTMAVSWAVDRPAGKRCAHRSLVTMAAEVSSQLVSMASTTRWRRRGAGAAKRRRPEPAAARLAAATHQRHRRGAPVDSGVCMRLCVPDDAATTTKIGAVTPPWARTRHGTVPPSLYLGDGIQQARQQRASRRLSPFEPELASLQAFVRVRVIIYNELEQA